MDLCFRSIIDGVCQGPYRMDFPTIASQFVCKLSIFSYPNHELIYYI